MTTLFQSTGLTKRYGNSTVLEDVSFDVRGGEIHALLGANGAGKSTLCKIIAGLTDATDGGMSLGGTLYQPSHKQASESLGVQIVQQELNQIRSLTVAENVLLNRLPNRIGIIGRRELDRRARRALDRFGLQDVATDAMVGTLGVGRQQMVEIATALDRRCRLLILDEPTAALSAAESQRLFECLDQLRREGIGMIYISHRLDEVAQWSDRVTVLRDGKHVGTRDTQSMSTDEMVTLMSGIDDRACEDFLSYANPQPQLRVVGITGGVVKDANFEVGRGERFGIAGLVGSGRTELVRLLFGADVPDNGTVQIGEDPPERFVHPRQATKAGLAMVTEDRKENGLLLDQSITRNTSLCSLRRLFSWLGVIQKRREIDVAEEMVDQLDIRCQRIEQSVGTLSGGNQQKVAVAKWLVQDAEVYIFDEPTRGIDVAARRRLYRLFESLSKAGKAIIIVSSDLEELFETCDRIGVMSAGRLVAQFARDQWSEEKIMQAAFSGHQSTAVVA